MQDRMNHKGKGIEAAKTTIIKDANDSTGVCWFASWGIPNVLDMSARAISTATGWPMTREMLWEAGERVVTLERAFNIRQGLTPEDDYNVPDRVIEAPLDGPAKGRSFRPYLKGQIHEYYANLGWDIKTGKPLRTTLKRLRLNDVIEDLWWACQIWS
jgi:aldehyde:ferredoxin oxidoreductase